MDSPEKNSYKYIPIKLLGKGSYGKAYLTECSFDIKF